MRILLWYWGRRGGGAQFTLGLAQALAARPDVSLRLSLSAQGELLDTFRKLIVPTDIVDTYSDLAGFAMALPRIPALRHNLMQSANEATVVVSGMTHLWTPLVAPGLARAGHAFVPVVHDATPHPGDFGWAWNWRLGRELDAARAAVALSAPVAQALARRRPALPLIRMELPALLTGPLPPRRPAPPGALRLLFFGRMRAYKGLDLLRDAFRTLHQAHPGATLRVVGEGDVEACAPGLAALPGVRVESRWVAEDGIPALLAEADALVAPYREASQSGVIPQALAMGVPVVATPVGGLSGQLPPGAGGVLAGAVTAAALAAALARLFEPGVLDRLRQEAKAAGAARCDWAAAADTLLAGLDRVLSAG
ncbi:glycosyltransferase family 4 protein [Falsiroseomonas selenitidurans]|uniref:Glycosyltransferase family 4 protein n=1 Tax=Falsiroseomonas selenitidurans TaxID=2716335 RepID=A0ABX1E685_9PROT|nr:glycosyltransferase family 4 protein [Falsiroseomonas selenitidurans]NKC32686.1 glycosyltransferase family 4 protein [Falsiroseomonas selenitidurans]OYW10570.1 MAG: glycosyl transferase family 1 [Rhodospirillales bacterium 12-71-4]